MLSVKFTVPNVANAKVCRRSFRDCAAAACGAINWERRKAQASSPRADNHDIRSRSVIKLLKRLITRAIWKPAAVAAARICFV